MKKEQRDKAREMLAEGYKQAEIAKALGITTRTIRNWVKDDEDKTVKAFEDPEEGWVMKYTAELGLTTPKTDTWSFIIYPESAPEDWRDRLEASGLSAIIGPLHDKDVWKHDSPETATERKGKRHKKGDPKKAHYHAGVQFPKEISLKRAAMYIQAITAGPVPQPCKDERGYEAYLSHHDKAGKALPGKAEYNAEDVVKLNDWQARPSKKDKAIMERQLEEYIIRKGFQSFQAAVTGVRFDLGDDYLQLLRHRGYYYSQLVYRNSKDMNDLADLRKRYAEEDKAEKEAAEHFDKVNEKTNKNEED